MSPLSHYIGPDVPTLQLAHAKPTSVTITWTQSQADIVDNYVINYYESVGCGDNLRSSASVSAAKNNYTLNGLDEDTTYGVTIAAVNGAGFSTSAVLVVTTVAICKN